MSSTLTHGWMKKTAYVFNIFLSDHEQWDWRGVSTVDFWIPVKSHWNSYADFERFFHDLEPQFNLNSHYRLSALPEPLVACEPLLACCNVLPLTFVKAKRWYIYEQPPRGMRDTNSQSHQIKSLELAVAKLTEMTNLLLRLHKPQETQTSYTESFFDLQPARLSVTPPRSNTPLEEDIVTGEIVCTTATVSLSPEPLTLDIFQPTGTGDVLSETSEDESSPSAGSSDWQCLEE